jgi:hypothetical protein
VRASWISRDRILSTLRLFHSSSSGTSIDVVLTAVGEEGKPMRAEMNGNLIRNANLLSFWGYESDKSNQNVTEKNKRNITFNSGGEIRSCFVVFYCNFCVKKSDRKSLPNSIFPLSQHVYTQKIIKHVLKRDKNPIFY